MTLTRRRGCANATPAPKPSCSRRTSSTGCGRQRSTSSKPTIASRIRRRHGDLVHNFWTDADHRRGLLRRTTWTDYRDGDPDVGDDPRHRRAVRAGGRVMGLPRLLDPTTGSPSSTHRAVARWIRCQRHPRVRPGRQALHPRVRGRLRSATRKGQPDLDRRRHRLRHQRLRPGHTHPIGVPPHRASVATGHADRGCRDRLRGRGDRRRGRGVGLDDRRLRTSRVRAGARVLHDTDLDPVERIARRRRRSRRRRGAIPRAMGLRCAPIRPVARR